jgi:hypothetical protein
MQQAEAASFLLRDHVWHKPDYCAFASANLFTCSVINDYDGTA